MTDFSPTDIRFIKLGENGRWEKSCIEEGTLRLGYQSDQHAQSLEGRWDEVRQAWSQGVPAGVATRHVNQIRDFYEQPRDTLWITFHNRALYWCFADTEVIEREDDKSRERKAVGGWSNRDLKGQPLLVENLDGRITQVQGFRGTLCRVGHADYLIQKIRGEQTAESAAATSAFDSLCRHVDDLIRSLWWHDFELLADILFTRAGWQRLSVMGKTEKNLDIDLSHPLSGRRAFVQVKSRADRSTLESSIAAFRAATMYEEMYFVVHTADPDVLGHEEPGVKILTGVELARHAINAGLTDWLIGKRG